MKFVAALLISLVSIAAHAEVVNGLYRAQALAVYCLDPAQLVTGTMYFKQGDESVFMMLIADKKCAVLRPEQAFAVDQVHNSIAVGHVLSNDGTPAVKAVTWFDDLRYDEATTNSVRAHLEELVLQSN